MLKKEIYSIKDWLPVKLILKDGIIKTKENYYIKILKVYPINFNLKSDFEKQAILNSYKLFLKTCDFDIQILIQNSKEDLSKNFQKIKNEKLKEENKKIKKIFNNYFLYMNKKNKLNKSAIKNFFIIIKNKKEKQIILENIISDLNEKYFKIKECLGRCGNYVKSIEDKNEIINLFKSFLN